MKKTLALLAVISSLILTGCSQVNSAATVGDVTISQTALQKSVDEIYAQRKTIDTSGMQLETGATLNRSQLRFMILTAIFDDIAKELKISVSNTLLSQTKSGLIAQSGGEATMTQNLVAAGIAPSSFDSYVRAVIISNQITKAFADGGATDAEASQKFSQLVAAKAKTLHIKVNPRYGTWDETSVDLVEVDAAGSAVASTTSTK